MVTGRLRAPFVVREERIMGNWITCGIYVRQEMAEQDGRDEMRWLLLTLTGHRCVPCEGGTGCGENGEEGDVSYYDRSDMLGYTMSYDYGLVGDGLAVIKRFRIDRDERWDNMFDLTEERLREVLEGMQDKGVNRDVLLEIGAKFGILI